MSLRPASAMALGGFTLVAGVLQILAIAMLGLARLEAFQRAASEGAGVYLLGALATGLGLLVVWLLRRRPLVAVAVFLTWQLLVYWPLARRTTLLGLAHHGEYILHHFTALLSAALCLTILRDWVRRRELGPARLVPAALGGLGASTLLALHVLEAPSLAFHIPTAAPQAATAALLASCVAAWLIVWPRAHPRALRFVVGILLVPLFLRIGLAFPEALSGAPVPPWGRPIVMMAVVAAATGTFLLFRPRLGVALRLGVTALSALATAILYIVYRRGFGELEDGVGGLAQSLFGFPLPYPNYVPDWKILTVMVGLFFILNTVYAGLVSTTDRNRGVALGLLCITGLGLTNPQLALMAGAALLLLLDTFTHDDARAPTIPPAEPVEAILAATARRLGLPHPVTLESTRSTVVALRGDVELTSVDMRARQLRSGDWEIDLRIGVIGRGRPDVELVPDAGADGPRPAHELGRTHRIRGSARALEQIGDAMLDALVPFPRSRARFWEAGTRLELGDDLARLDKRLLAGLIERTVQRDG